VEVNKIFELPKAQFGHVLPLFDPDQPNSTMIFSTLEDRTPGKAYVDDIDRPRRCLITINFYHLTFVSDAVDQHWLNEAVGELRQAHSVSLTWSLQLASRLQPPSSPAEEIDRFEFDDYVPEQEERSTHTRLLAEGAYLRPITTELFAHCLWRDEITLACGTPENFLRHGIGMCLMVKDEICSEAYAVFLRAGKFEIGAITDEKYHQRGYAYLTCQHLIKLCAERGYPTYWSCRQANAASVATAHKLGYRTQRAYKFLYYPQIV
jgi:RimJ/RimL family protein N-acetyltransferase